MKYTYDVFISYSSKDREIISRLSDTLISKNISVWLDEREILIGEPILDKIEEGLNSSRYLAIWLSKNSVNSNWVRQEWKVKCREEINSERTIILPLLGEKCEIPSFLLDKKYADFSRSFDEGLETLLKFIELNCSVVIESCIKSIIEGVDAEQCAEKLGQIALRSSDELAFLGLWESALKTQTPYSAIDHVVYFFSRVMIESKDTKLKKIGFDILLKSARSNSEIIVDKFAYAAGDIALESEDRLLRKQIIEFIKRNYEGTNAIPKEKYGITRKRMEEVNIHIFDE